MRVGRRPWSREHCGERRMISTSRPRGKSQEPSTTANSLACPNTFLSLHRRLPHARYSIRHLCISTYKWLHRSSEARRTHLSDAWHAEEVSYDWQLAQEREHDREEVAVQWQRPSADVARQ